MNKEPWFIWLEHVFLDAPKLQRDSDNKIQV